MSPSNNDHWVAALLENAAQGGLWEDSQIGMTPSFLSLGFVAGQDGVQSRHDFCALFEVLAGYEHLPESERASYALSLNVRECILGFAARCLQKVSSRFQHHGEALRCSEDFRAVGEAAVAKVRANLFVAAASPKKAVFDDLVLVFLDTAPGSLGYALGDRSFQLGCGAVVRVTRDECEHLDAVVPLLPCADRWQKSGKIHDAKAKLFAPLPPTAMLAREKSIELGDVLLVGDSLFRLGQQGSWMSSSLCSEMRRRGARTLTTRFKSCMRAAHMTESIAVRLAKYEKAL